MSEWWELEAAAHTRPVKQRRRTDSWRGRAAWAWEKIIPLIAVLIAGYAVLGVQAQRRDAVRVQCRDQNTRHEIVYLGLLTSPVFRPPRPETPAQADQRKTATKAFADLIVPARDCELLARQLVR